MSREISVAVDGLPISYEHWVRVAEATESGIALIFGGEDDPISLRIEIDSDQTHQLLDLLSDAVEEGESTLSTMDALHLLGDRP